MKKLKASSWDKFSPCYDPRTVLGEDWEGTLLDLLEMEHIKAEDRIWAATKVLDDKKTRLFAVACAREVQHLMEDERSIRALDVSEAYAHGRATDSELYAARNAARAAARDAARDAAGDAARDAARAAAWAAARDAAWAAARAAARDAAWAAARDAARDAAWAAARDAAWDAAWAAARAAAWAAARDAARDARAASDDTWGSARNKQIEILKNML